MPAFLAAIRAAYGAIEPVGRDRAEKVTQRRCCKSLCDRYLYRPQQAGVSTLAIPVKGDAVRTDPGPRSADDARNWTPCQFVIAACRPFYDEEICDARFVARARADRHGGYRLDGLPPVDYLVLRSSRFRRPRGASVSPGGSWRPAPSCWNACGRRPHRSVSTRASNRCSTSAWRGRRLDCCHADGSSVDGQAVSVARHRPSRDRAGIRSRLWPSRSTLASGTTTSPPSSVRAVWDRFGTATDAQLNP